MKEEPRDSARLIPPMVRVCEGCGKRVKLLPWPEGWFESGVSEKYAKLRDGSPKRVVAIWCSPLCHAKAHGELPLIRDLKDSDLC